MSGVYCGHRGPVDPPTLVLKSKHNMTQEIQEQQQHKLPLASESQLTLEQLTDMWKEDAKLDIHELGDASLEVARLHAKYLRIWGVERRRLAALSFSFKELKLAKREYYMGTMSRSELERRKWTPFQLKVLRTDLDNYLEADKDLQRIQVKVETTTLLVEICTDILKSIHSRNWSIRNAIQDQAFKKGTQDL